MTEQHPSTSAVGAFLDEQTEIAVLAQKFFEEEGRPEGRAEEHWFRAEREVRARHAGGERSQPEPPATDADRRVEAAMHLAQ